MSNRININKLSSSLQLIVRAIEKGVGEDVRGYLLSTDKATNNAVRLMRADNINTNLRDSVVSDTMELKYFNRSAWVGCLLIDRANKVTYTICTKQTLEGIPRKPNRRIPHYLQTILYVQNHEVEADGSQIDMFDQIPELTIFSDEDYRYDYENIMEDDLTFSDNYLHLVVVYEAAQLHVQSVSLRLLDKDFQTAKEYALEDMLKPDFGELTVNEENKKVKDTHDLISVKPKLKRTGESEKEQETKISAKKTEEKRQA